jgi:cytochrome d ubiquinol oxidase subunit I
MLTGKGYLHGTQSQLSFLPLNHTDFIFAVLAEEFGLMGGIILLLLYALIVGRGFVISANAWMNSPAGFTLADGKPVDVSPLAAMLNPASLHETIHMTLAAFAASGFAVAGIHAYLLLKDRENLFHRKALEIALAVGGAAAVLQPLSGDMSARFVARNQPVKLAALEGQFETVRGAPLRIGGIPDVASRTTRFAIEVPKGLSLLAYHDPDARVQGLTAFPREDWPDPAPVHLPFPAMVGGGTILALQLPVQEG